MMGRTHMAFGFLAGLLTYSFFSAKWYIFIPIATIAALFPDVDHENSKINRILPITRWIPKFFKHRGFFHSIFPAAIILIITIYTKNMTIGMPIVIGYLAHLLSDCITQMGCNLLHPVSNLRITGFIETGGVLELITLGATLCLNVIMIINKIF